MLPAQKAQYFVGDEIALSVVAQPLSVKKPDGSTVEVAAGAKFTGADQPGVYSVEPGGRRFVVNLLPEESRTTPLAPERLEGFGVPLNREAAASLPSGARQPAQAQAAEIESRQKLWRWLVLGALATLLLETLIATKLSRQTANPQYSPI